MIIYILYFSKNLTLSKAISLGLNKSVKARRLESSLAVEGGLRCWKASVVISMLSKNRIDNYFFFYKTVHISSLVRSVL